MNKIDDRLYQGGMPHKLHKLNNSWAIVSLTETSDPIDSPEECDLVYLKFPIANGAFPGVYWLRAVVECIEALYKFGMNIYIHCLAGVSRSAMVTAAFLMKKHGWNRDAALEMLSAGNPKIDLNSDFMAGLMKWQQFLETSSHKEWKIR